MAPLSLPLEHSSCLTPLIPALPRVAPANLGAAANSRDGTLLDAGGASAARLWDELVEGRLTIVDHDVDATHARLSLTHEHPRLPVERRVSNAELLASVLTGCAQKVKALEAELSAGAISLRVSSTLKTFGLDRPVRHAPLALAILAALRALGASVPVYHVVRTGDPARFEIRMSRPEAALEPRLTPVEYEVLRAVVAGASHRQAGAHRGRSPRTIANQLRSISEKLGVSGRFPYIKLAVVTFFGDNAGSAHVGSRSAE